MIADYIRRLEDKLPNNVWRKWFNFKTSVLPDWNKHSEVWGLTWRRDPFNVIISGILIIVFFVVVFVGIIIEQPFLFITILPILPLASLFIGLDLKYLYKTRKDDPAFFDWMVRYHKE